MNDIVISKIALAMYVPGETGNPVHKDRPFHGLVLNDDNSEKDYLFSDGNVLNTKGGELFYLPKGSSYTVEDLTLGGCYAINFDANISGVKPFSMAVRNYDAVLKEFKDSVRKWKQQSDTSHVFIRKCLYSILLEIYKEHRKSYLPDAKLEIIAPAMKKISSDFTDPEISVASLASLCSVSEVYFRTIFLTKFGVSPREYIISRRLDYASQLLRSGQFPISEIASICGYGDISHFSREFKKSSGYHPQSIDFFSLKSYN